MKKFELTTECITFFGIKLFRIKALVQFDDVNPGDLGGYVEKEENLDHDGDAWIRGNAWISGNGDFTCHHGLGSEFRTTTSFRLKDGGIGVNCGSFYGTLEEFRGEVRKTHGENKYAKEYLMLADLMELHFEKEEG